MWTQAQLVKDLRELGLGAGAAVLAHTSLRAIGPIEGGAQTLVAAFREVLGPEGTLLVPTFTFDHSDPAGWREPPQTQAELEKRRAQIPVFDPETTPADTRRMGMFPEIVRQQPDAFRSNHPALSFAAIGANAEFLTRDAPFHYPLGSHSPLARLHQINGDVVLIGVGQKVNTSLHLAECWASAPYIHRRTTLKTGPGQWTRMEGSPECSKGFVKIEPLLRQSRLLKLGSVGGAESRRMRQGQAVSMAVAMLQGNGAALLCDDPACPWCTVARKFTAVNSTSSTALPADP